MHPHDLPTRHLDVIRKAGRLIHTRTAREALAVELEAHAVVEHEEDLLPRPPWAFRHDDARDAPSDDFREAVLHRAILPTRCPTVTTASSAATTAYASRQRSTRRNASRPRSCSRCRRERLSKRTIRQPRWSWTSRP